MQRRAGGVLERVADGIADHRGLVGFGPLAAVGAGFHVFLGVVPGAAAVVENGGHEDAGDGADHQQRRHSLRADTHLSEDEADGDRHADGQQPGHDHLPQGAGGDDVDALAVRRLLGAFQNAGVLTELPPHLVDDVIGGLADGPGGQRRKQEDQHGAEQAGNEHFRLGDVHRGHEVLVVVLDLVQVGGEQQEGGERRAADGIALGERLGGVAHGVQPVGLDADFLRLLAHLDNAAGVVGDGPEGVHGQDVGGGAQHAHGRYRGAEEAGVLDAARQADVVGRHDGDGDDDNRHGGRLHGHRKPGDDVGRRSGFGGFGDGTHRAVLIFGVVLRDVNEDHGRRQPDQSADPKVKPRVRRLRGGHQPIAADAEADARQHRGEVIPLVERLHRVAVFVRLHHHDADDGCQQAEGAHDQRKQHALQPEVGIQRHAQDHGADVLGRRGLEQIGAAAGAVAHVVAHQIGNHRRVARVVLRDTRLHLAHQVGADVSRLGVDAAAKLRKQRHETGPEAVAHNQEGDLLVLDAHQPQQQEQAADPDQAHGDDEQAGHRAAAKCDAQAVVQAGAGGGRRADVGANGDEHADIARDAGAQGAKNERPGDVNRHLDAVHRIGSVFGPDVGVQHEEDDRDRHRQHGDGDVLPPQEGLGAFADGVRNGSHLLRAVVLLQHPARQIDGKGEAKHATHNGQYQLNHKSSSIRIRCEKQRAVRDGINRGENQR